MSPAQQDQDDGNQPVGNVQKYKRRSGASSQKGTDFEIKMAALVYLRARRLLRTFQLAMNDEDAGGFDDLVLIYKEKEVLIQLKHLDSGSIVKESLAAERGTYSLNKMFSSIEKRLVPSNARDTSFVLFSDRAINVGTSRLDHDLDPLVLDVTCTSDDPKHIFKVDLSDYVCNPFKNKCNAEKFVDKLYFFSHQIDVDFLDEIIKQEFIKLSFRIIPDYNSLHVAYLDKIKEYWQKTNKVYYLTESWNDWETIQNIISVKSDVFADIRFDGQVLSDFSQKLTNPNHQKIHVICRDSFPALRCIKVNQALQQCGSRRYLFTSLDEREDVLKTVLKLWEGDSYDTLVIDSGDSCSPLKFPVGNILPDGKKKLILVSSEGNSVSDFLAGDSFNDWQQLNDTFSFHQLDETSRQTVLGHEVTLQGVKLKLSDLGVERVLVGKNLVSILQDGSIELGNELKLPDEPYISRTLCKQIAIKEEIFSLTEGPDKFYIKGIPRQQLRSQISKVRKSMGITQIVAEDEPFRDFTEGEKCVDSGHVLEMRNGVLHWCHSTGDPKLLFKFLSCSESEMEDIKRFMENCESSNAKEEILTATGMRKVIVSGEPGAGKTLLFQNVACKLKEQFPNCWIVPLDLKDLTNKNDSDMDRGNVLRTLADAAAVQQSPVAMAFLEEAVEHTGNVFVLCDGFDEIWPKYSSVGSKVVTTILETKVRMLWVSSRQVVVDTIEQLLDTKAFFLEPFTTEDVRRYLNNFLDSKEVSKLIDMIKCISTDGTKSVSYYPLHLMMSKQLIKSDRFPKGKLNLYKLYEEFINSKLVDYLEKIVSKNDESFEDYFKQGCMKSHKICSIVALDIVNELEEKQRKSILEEYQELSKKIDDGREKTGFIDRLLKDGRPRFVHRTFAEYFAALWLEEHKDCNLDLVGAITFDPHHNVLRSVFNQLLAKGCTIHLAVLNDDVSGVENSLKQAPDLNQLDAGGRTALHLTALTNDDDVATDIMKKMLHHKAELDLDLEARDRLLKLTPLYYAVKAHFWNGVRLFLQHGAKVENNISNNQCVEHLRKELSTNKLNEYLNLNFEVNWPIFYEYKTALHLAANCGDLNCVKFLLENGADTEARDIHGYTALHDAISREKMHIVQYLLENDVSFRGANKFGDTPLHMAVRLPKMRSVVKLLLDRKADINVKNQDGDTPLHDGVRFGDSTIVNYLLESGASVDLQNKDGNTPLHSAISKNNSNCKCIVGLLLERSAVTAAVNKDGDTPLHIAIKKSNSQMVKLLLKNNAPIAAKNKHGNTPLHAAAREQDIEIVHVLLRCGASTRDTNKFGDTPLHVAVRYNNKDIIGLLLDSNASTTAQNNFGETPLHEAAKELDHHIVELLLKYGARTSDVNRDQETPLHIAAKYSTAMIVKSLLRHGARADAINKDGDTPVHFAISCRRNRFKQDEGRSCETDVIAQLLWKDKTCLSIANNLGNTPLHIAVEKGNLRIVRFLLVQKAPLTMANQNGDTPLSIANKYGHSEIISVLQNHLKKMEESSSVSSG